VSNKFNFTLSLSLSNAMLRCGNMQV